MLKLFKNYSLKNHNTFGFDVNALNYIVCESAADVTEFLKNSYAKENLLVIGGGSNLCFTSNFNGTVISPEINYINIKNRTNEHVFIEAGCGVVWDDLVKFTVDNNFYGLENLSYIPGKVGACPVQNIGAYGAEVKDTIYEVNTICIANSASEKFNNQQCKFGYRESIFKNELSGKYIVTSVTFKLSLNNVLNTNYKDVQAELQNHGEINIENIRKAIIEIRKRKLPDPSELGNAGSFFKNPSIPISQINSLKQKYENIPVYPINETEAKTAAAWLIDQCGWKGFTRNGAGVHKNQCLVLVNHGSATGKDILELSKEIQKSVAEKFGIDLQREVQIV